MKTNFTLLTDSYKFGAHWNMLIEGTEYVYSYGEARVGGLCPKILWNGLQSILIRFFEGEIVTQEMIEEGKEIAKFHLGSENAYNIGGWQTIVSEFGGKLPLEIKAAPEGTLIPEGNVLFTIVNTDPRFAWLTNYVESILMKAWYPTTVATRSYEIVQEIKKHCLKSSDIPEIWKFLLHDFGYRSTSSEESSQIGGCAHLINSLGTDTVPALKFAKEYYSADYATLGFSVPASEHSIATPFGPDGGEVEYVEELMKRFPDGILSLVADSFGIEGFVTNVMAKLKDKVIKRTENSNAPITKIVVRPDSQRFKGDTPKDQVLWIVEQLGEIYGYSVNSKGFKTLAPCCGVLYGDGLSVEEIYEIYNHLIENGWSADNCVVGQGGGLLQKLDRDSQRFAIKCSAQRRNGEWINVQKKPSDATKASKAGRLKLVKHVGAHGFQWGTINEDYPLYNDMPDELVTVFKNGEITKKYSFDEVRKNAGF